MPHLLLVDDERDVRESFELLFSAEGFDVETASDGCDALNKVRKHRPDVVLTDLVMPRMDGLQLCRRLRADNTTLDIPIVVLSAYTASHTPEIEECADAFVQKPADFDQLLGTVRQYI